MAGSFTLSIEICMPNNCSPGELRLWNAKRSVHGSGRHAQLAWVGFSDARPTIRRDLKPKKYR